MDFAKAFDSVSHPRLILKLHHYGIRGQLLGWFKNYLTNRTQRTVLQGATSAPLPVLSGVPQGSILGPLLFLIYINNLPSVIDCNSSIGLFADDSKCYRTILNSLDCTNLQNDLDVISEWSKDWRLRFNTSKCELLSITCKRNPIIHDYRLDSHSLTRPSSQKDLGITISKDLKWNSHINQAVSKGYRMLGFRRRHTNRHFDSETKKVLYRSLIRPHCGYASEVWAPSSIVNLKKVESLQRRATRFILPTSDLNYRDRLIKLNLVIPLSYWHEIKDLVFFFKCLKGLYNFPINNFVKSKQSTRFTRNNCPLDMSVPLCKTKLFQTSYFNRIPKMWNALTPSIRCCSSVSTFRSAIYNSGIKG